MNLIASAPRNEHCSGSGGKRPPCTYSVGRSDVIAAAACALQQRSREAMHRAALGDLTWKRSV